MQLSVHPTKLRKAIVGMRSLQGLNPDSPHAEFKLVSTLLSLPSSIQTDVISAVHCACSGSAMSSPEHLCCTGKWDFRGKGHDPSSTVGICTPVHRPGSCPNITGTWVCMDKAAFLPGHSS